MSDTPRTVATLQTIFADNGTKAITAQNLRDFVVSILDVVDFPVSTFIKTLLDDADAPTARGTLGLGTASTHDVAASGNASVSQVVYGNDTRLSDSRTPTAHAASHASAGSDPLTIGESQVTSLVSDLAAKAPIASPTFTGTASGTFSGNGSALTTLNASNLSSGTVGTARLGSGTASSSTFLRGDQTYAAVTLPESSITNLTTDLAAKAPLASPVFTGTASGAFSGNGAALTNLAAGNIATGTVPTARLGSGTASSTTFLAGDQTYKTISSGWVGTATSDLHMAGQSIDQVNNLSVNSSIACSGTCTVQNLVVQGMPTSDPNVLGELWNNSGQVMISAGG